MDRKGLKAKALRSHRASGRDKTARQPGRQIDEDMPRPANDTEVPDPRIEAGTGVDVPDEALPYGEDLADRDVTVVTAAPEVAEEAAQDAAHDAGEDDQGHEGHVAAEDPPEGREEEAAVAAERKEEEPQSFLAMYFRDMAELDVLRPEQEFETARNIEEGELELWRILLGFTPAAAWAANTVEKAMGAPFADFKGYRAMADRARRKASIPVRTRFEKSLVALARKLKELDIDRIFVDAVVGQLHDVDSAMKAGRPVELPFATNTKGFREFLDAGLGKAARVKQAKNEFVKANLRLVVSIARRFNHGRLPLPDLIQEGNIGLMKAVERYDYRRGFRFSTYASWWIRHAISRALADKGRAVRLPVHMIDAYHRISKSERELQSKLERPATTEEIAIATGIETEKLQKMKTFLSEMPVSLDRPLSDEDGRKLIDVLVDPNEAPSPPEQIMTSETQGEMLKLLGGLKPIEADILRKRFGLVNDRERTLKEIGDEYHLSRERVRQLQEQALGKMRRAMSKRDTL